MSPYKQFPHDHQGIDEQWVKKANATPRKINSTLTHYMFELSPRRTCNTQRTFTTICNDWHYAF